MKYFGILLLALCGCSGSNQTGSAPEQDAPALVRTEKAPYYLVLGTAQDAGKPHLGCERKCCSPDVENQFVTCIGLVDPIDSVTVLMEATPDLTAQIRWLNEEARLPLGKTPDAIFLTHAHIGHYTGLMYLGRESMNAHEVPVYAMPRMASFLGKNGPWNQLVSLKNIVVTEMKAGQSYAISSSIEVEPLLVPHRDEYSETVGYRIRLGKKSLLFIPDIDKWSKWDQSIATMIQEVDVAFIDGTFFSGKELNNRDMSTIPHPSVEETMALLSPLTWYDRSKVHFIHLNHTNPLWKNGEERRRVLDAGFKIAEERGEKSD